MTTSAPPGVHEFTSAGPIDVDVRVRSGDVTVTAADRLVATVAVHPQDGSEASRDAAEQTAVSYRTAACTCETPADHRLARARRGQVRVSLSVPHESLLTADLGSADVRTEGRLGGVVGRRPGRATSPSPNQR